MGVKKRGFYSPWGYQEENNYQSDEIIFINDLESFFAGVFYNKDDNKIHFVNKDGEEKATIDVSEFVKSDSIIDKVEYNDGILKITFTNGDVITVNLSELFDENEFKDGLIVDGHTIKVLIDSTGEPYLSVSENGVKISGINAAIKVETDRAIEVEDSLDTKIENEISRATSAETLIITNLNNEITRATEAESTNNTKILQEIANRIADVDEEEARAKAEEAKKVDKQIISSNGKALIFNESDGGGAKFENNDGINSFVGVNDAGNGGIDAQIYAIDKDTKSGSRIDVSNGGIYYTVGNKSASERMVEANEIAVKGDIVGVVDDLYDKLGYKDNDTLQTTNEHEVAFGEWNASSTDIEPSGQTIFSIGIGTSAHDRKNAFEVRKDGTMYAWVEGGYVELTKILAQLTNEVYDSDSSNNG